MSPVNPKFCVRWSKQKDLLYVAHAPNCSTAAVREDVGVFTSSCKENLEGGSEITRKNIVSKADRNGE